MHSIPSFPLQGLRVLRPELPILMTFKVTFVAHAHQSLSQVLSLGNERKIVTFRPTEASHLFKRVVMLGLVAHTVIPALGRLSTGGSGVQGQPEIPGEFLSERPGEGVGDNSAPLQTAGCTPRHGVLDAEPWCAILSWGHTPAMTCEVGTIRNS